MLYETQQLHKENRIHKSDNKIPSTYFDTKKFLTQNFTFKSKTVLWKQYAPYIRKHIHARDRREVIYH